MDKLKITTGFVIQRFDNKGNCVEQNFTAGDQVDWENDEGVAVDSEDYYFPFDMVQPKRSKR